MVTQGSQHVMTAGREAWDARQIRRPIGKLQNRHSTMNSAVHAWRNARSYVRAANLLSSNKCDS